MRKAVLAASLAAALTLPQVGSVAAGESGRSLLQQGDSRVLLPMPGAESVPWLATGFSLVVPQQYLAVGPRIDSLGPFLLPPVVPPMQLSSSSHTGAPATATE